MPARYSSGFASQENTDLIVTGILLSPNYSMPSATRSAMIRDGTSMKVTGSPMATNIRVMKATKPMIR